MNPLHVVGSVLRWSVIAALFLLLALVVLVSGRWVSPRRLFPFSQWTFGWMARAAGARVNVDGRERLDPKRGYVYIFNHTSFLDHFVLASSVPGFLVGVEKVEARNIPIYGLVTKWWGNVSIDRSDAEQAIELIRESQEVLASGTSICVAPEGTRSRDGRLGSFKKGGFHMAQEMGAPIAPVSIVGMRDINPDRRFLLRPGPVRVVLHEPLETRGADVEALIRDTRKAILSGGVEERLPAQPGVRAL